MITSLLVVWAIGFVGENIAGRYLERARLSSFAGNVRWDIWTSAISQMKPYEYLIGAGPNVFRDLALRGGYNFYAHSVFVDTFVTLGLLGIVTLIAFILSCLFSAMSRRNSYAFSVTILSVFLYITHGSITGSLDFWTLLGLAYSSLSLRK